MSLKRIDIRLSPNVNFKYVESISCVESLYFKNLEKIEISTVKEKVNYLNIYQTDQVKENKKEQQDGKFLDIYEIFNFETYNNTLNGYDRKKYILDYLHNTILYLCECHKWPKEPFHKAYQLTIDQNLIYNGFYKNKLFQSPNKNYYCGLYYIWDLDGYNIFEILFNNSKQEIIRRKCYHDTGMVFVIEWASWKGSNEVFYYKYKGPAKIFECRIRELLEGKQYDLTKSNSDFFKQ